MKISYIYYELLNIRQYTLPNSLLPFLYKEGNDYFARQKRIDQSVTYYEQGYEYPFFQGVWEFENYVYKSSKGAEQLKTSSVVYEIYYKTIPELYAAFSGMRNLFLWLIPFIVDCLFGYFNGNFYHELIYSLFGDNDRFSSIDRKKV